MRPKDKTCDYPLCSRCGSNTNVRKKGFWELKKPGTHEKYKEQRFHCSACKFHFTRNTGGKDDTANTT